jgi:flagellar hook protein FlgE
MLGTIYIGLSGMSAYSKGLDVISNNVANLNTPGFKLTAPSFSDALYRNGDGAIEGSSGTPTGGAGVSVDTHRASFKQGEMRDTGNPLDAGVEGNGFFVLDRDGQQLFTRAGQFEFDRDGVLVERGTGGKVQVSTSTQALTTFDLDELRTYDPKATQTVSMTGSLSRSGTATYEISSLFAIDASGARHTLKAKFVRNDTDSSKWSVEVTDVENRVVGSGQIQFNADGTPATDANKITVNVKPKELPEFAVTLSFGEAGKFSGVTSILTNTSSQLSMLKQDGFERGTLTATAFDERGQISLTYSNGQKTTPATLLLAQFDSSEQLQALGDGLYALRAGADVSLASAQTAGRGRIVGSKIEMSNVDLTQQFTDLIIIQRGYQASSQMTSVANEMMQQLLSMGERR